MPIKPPRRPTVSAATGRPSGEARRSDDPRRGDDARRGDDRSRDPGRGPGRPPGDRPRHDRPPADRPARTVRPEWRDGPSAPVLNANRPAGLYLSCPAGVEGLLAAEVARILGDRAQVQASRGGVEVQPPADARDAAARHLALIDYTLRLNLESRLAQRVLWRVASRVYRHEDDLYVLARAIDWSQWITPHHTLRVDVTARQSFLRSLNFAALRVKDAVCDDLRERSGERPSVDTRHPDLGLVLYLDDLEATLYVDTSGEALFKRGWREDTGEAPLKETLAAAMLAAADWQGRPEDGPLLDPCCGAGTIPIEAAQIACGIAPGIQRRFAFEKLLPFKAHSATWLQLKQAAKARQHPPRVPIFAGDVSFRMTDFATRNAERAGVRHAIEFKTADALQRPVPVERGIMMFNPPYGERIDTKGTAGRTYQARQQWQSSDRDTASSPDDDAPPTRAQLADDPEASGFFQALSSHWKKQYTGWTAWVLSPDLSLPGAMRLKESRRTVMYNGPIECRLFRFDLVAGSLKRRAAAAPGAPEDRPSSAAGAPGSAEPDASTS